MRSSIIKQPTMISVRLTGAVCLRMKEMSTHVAEHVGLLYSGMQRTNCKHICNVRCSDTFPPVTTPPGILSINQSMNLYRAIVQRRVLQCGYAESKRNVLWRILNMLTDGAVRQFSGREFQSLPGQTPLTFFHPRSVFCDTACNWIS